MRTSLQGHYRRWRQWRMYPDRPFLLWIALELVGVAVAISVVEYLAGWADGTQRRIPWLDLTTPLPLPGIFAVVLFWGLLWLQPRLWPWPQWRVPLWGALVVCYGLLSATTGHFLLLGALISGYGVLAYARVTRSARESRATVALLVCTVALGSWHNATMTLAQFGIWLLGVVFVQTFTGLGLRERVARQHSENLLAALELAHQQLRDYATQVAENATLHERERLAHEMHDTLVQGLAATVMHLDAALATPKDTPGVAHDLIVRAHTLARETMRESRAAILALAPATSLPERLALLGQETTVAISVMLAPECRSLPPGLTEVCWRVCQESVRNATTHGQAQHIQIEMTCDAKRLYLTITDDGLGFAVGEVQRPTDQGGFGLSAMRQRVADVGGTCDIISAINAGTQVAATMPFPHEVRL
ncbi:MAG: sensor histidine kinase [Ktedonobacterales bacterium]|nr:sensor histidine kinase [Ktedonobacterales bacterium]